MVYRRSEAAQARQDEARDEVLRAARAVVAANGIGGLGMAAVAAEAGVAVGSLYRHFASKSDLVAEVLTETCGHELDVLRSIGGGPGTGAERLHDAVTVFARRALSSGKLAPAMICEPTSAPAEQLRRTIRSSMADILAGMVADGEADGSLPPQDAACTGVAIVGAVSEVLTRPGPPPSGARREALVATLGTLALRAAGSLRHTALQEGP